VHERSGQLRVIHAYWLTLHIARGNAVVLSVLVAAQFLPMLPFGRRAGTIVVRHRPVRVVIVTQSAQAAGSLALGLPLLAGWMPVWYLWVLSFVVGSVQAVDVPARQMFLRDLVGDAELRRGSSLYAAVTGMAKIAGPAWPGSSSPRAARRPYSWPTRHRSRW